MTVAMMDDGTFDNEPDKTNWRESLKQISDCLFELANDDRYELPNWFRSACERTSVYVLDPSIDILFGRVPELWKRGVQSALGNVNSIMLRQK